MQIADGSNPSRRSGLTHEQLKGALPEDWTVASRARVRQTVSDRQKKLATDPTGRVVLPELPAVRQVASR